MVVKLLRRFEVEFDPTTLFEMARKIMRKPSPRAVDWMCRLARTHPSPEGRLFATYWLRESQRASETLVEILEDRGEYVEIRAEAAESLGYIWEWANRSHFVFRWVASRLMAALEEPEAEIRFWACYSLGVMRVRKAIPALRGLAAHDDRLVTGWWKVSEEATDAIGKIFGRKYPDRQRDDVWVPPSWHRKPSKN